MGGGGPHTAVGHPLVRMSYDIGLGKRETETLSENLAHTTSFTKGISLSEIRWGYYNAGAGGAAGFHDANIEFTLHDIAGETLKQFMKVKSNQYIIFYWGPDSSGAKWPSNYAIFDPIINECTLEFSNSQGFTYKFAGAPYGRRVDGQTLSLSQDITMNGLDAGDAKHSNTWADYMKELEAKWKFDLGPAKKGTATIEIHHDTQDSTGGELAAKTPVTTEKRIKYKGHESAGKGGEWIEPLTIPSGTTVGKAIAMLWQKRFVEAAQDGKFSKDEKPTVHVNYVEYKGKNVVEVKLNKQKTTDTATQKLPVCIGDDGNCGGAKYRAQITEIEFGGQFNVISVDRIAKGAGTSPSDQAQGQTVTEIDAEKKHENPCGGGTQLHESQMNLADSPGTQPSVQPTWDGWGALQFMANYYKNPEFRMDIELPYSFGFSPKYHGGELDDAFPGKPMGAVKITCGVDLKFFWYTDHHCSSLAPVPMISTCYKIAKVQHTIGLNGNTTQVTLMHVTVGG